MGSRGDRRTWCWGRRRADEGPRPPAPTAPWSWLRPYAATPRRGGPVSDPVSHRGVRGGRPARDGASRDELRSLAEPRSPQFPTALHVRVLRVPQAGDGSPSGRQLSDWRCPARGWGAGDSGAPRRLLALGGVRKPPRHPSGGRGGDRVRAPGVAPQCGQDCLVSVSRPCSGRAGRPAGPHPRQRPGAPDLTLWGAGHSPHET